MNPREAMAALQAAPKFGNQVELLNVIEAHLFDQAKVMDAVRMYGGTYTNDEILTLLEILK